jgi:hypothetical protein
MESVTLDTEPGPLTLTMGPLLFTEAVTSPTVLPEPSTRSTVPGALVVPPGLSSHVQRTEKLQAYPCVPTMIDSEE